MKERLINFVRHLLYFKLFIQLEFKKNRSLGWAAILKSWPKGFLSISPLIYDFENNNSEDYISDWNRLKYASRINGKKGIVLDEKLLFHIMNKENKHVLPVVSLIRNKKIFIGTLDRMEEVSVDVFYAFLKQFKAGLIIKPLTGGGGNGISKVIWNVDDIFFSEFCNSKEAFVKTIHSGRDYLMTEIISQTGLSHSIFPHSINSIRVLTMMDPRTNQPFIATAVHRFGVAKSGVVDNWSAGGLSVKIDVTTGIMGKGATYPRDGSLQWYSAHPETHVQIKRKRIQNWDDITASVLNMAQQYFYLPYIGWDIVPLEDGHIYLEGNNNSDVNLLQIHAGLKKFNAIRRFYKSFEVI